MVELFEEYSFLGYNAMQSDRSPLILQRNSFILKMKVVCVFSSEMLENLYCISWYYNPEDSTLHDHCFENFESNIEIICVKQRKNSQTCRIYDID